MALTDVQEKAKTFQIRVPKPSQTLPKPSQNPVLGPSWRILESISSYDGEKMVLESSQGAQILPKIAQEAPKTFPNSFQIEPWRLPNTIFILLLVNLVKAKNLQGYLFDVSLIFKISKP